MPYEHTAKPSRTTWGEICEESTGTIIVAGYSDYFDKRKCDPSAMVYGIAKQIDDVIFRERNACQPMREALENYGGHRPSCDAVTASWDCSCGWDDARAAIAKAEGRA